MADKVEKLLEQWRGSWVLLAQAAVWVLGIVAGFLLPPPVGAGTESGMWVRFAQFVVTVVVGLVLLAALRWQRKKDTWRWALISVLALVLATGTFFGYQVCVAQWTVFSKGGQVVIGGELTEFGRTWRDEEPEKSLQEKVDDLAGQLTMVWTRESIEQRRLVLAGLYVLAMPLFTVCIIATVQAVRCAAPEKRSRGRSRRKKVPKQPTPEA
jgi:hypothetical protein